MSLNTAHVNGGVLIHAGETIILFSDNVTLKFSGHNRPEFRGDKNGRIYLTTHRVIFNSKSLKDAMLSFSFPFVTLREVKIEQPIFGANYVYGTVVAQPNGNWDGEAEFKMSFNSGGAIEFGQALLQSSHIAQTVDPRNFDNPPPYTPPQSNYYAAPPPAYSASPNGYYGWLPPTQAFPQQPPANSVFMTDAPPPYPGIVPGSTPFNVPRSQPQPQSQMGFQAPGYQQQQPLYPPPSQNIYPQGPASQAQYPQAPASQTQYPQAPPYQFQSTDQYPGGFPHGYPQANQGYGQSHPGYPQGGPGYPQGGVSGYQQGNPQFPVGNSGYPPMNPAFPQGNHGYPQQQQQQQQQYPGYPSNLPSGGF